MRHDIEWLTTLLTAFCIRKMCHPHFSLVIFVDKAAGIFCGSKKSPRNKMETRPAG